MIIGMDNWEDDLFLTLLINSKKLTPTKDFKSIESSAPDSHSDKKVKQCFQILQEHMKQSVHVQSNIDAFITYMEMNIGTFIGTFEKDLQGKLD